MLCHYDPYCLFLTLQVLLPFQCLFCKLILPKSYAIKSGEIFRSMQPKTGNMSELVWLNYTLLSVFRKLLRGYYINNYFQDCLLCPTGFSANMAFMSALGSVSSLLVVGRKPSMEERVAVFSDALNHASIIDGIRLAERQQEVEIFVYRHCNMVHLEALLYVFSFSCFRLSLYIFFASYGSTCILFNRSTCKMKKKVVITDRWVLHAMDSTLFFGLPSCIMVSYYVLDAQKCFLIFVLKMSIFSLVACFAHWSHFRDHCTLYLWIMKSYLPYDAACLVWMGILLQCPSLPSFAGGMDFC